MRANLGGKPLRQRPIEKIVDVLRHGGIGQGLGPTSELRGEIRARLINVELKINALREGSAGRLR
ncbi:MAG TPA: hypothetical protein VG758_29475 [Hyphomicrobiaceae bacterium]|jgi:hypothetical protein|nr:hypothetical protein [Hyphomicrobiaceae bacterium]